MATATLTDDFTTMTDCSTTTGWAGSRIVLDTDDYKEGSSCISNVCRTVGNNDSTYTKPSGSWDLSDTHIRIWFQMYHYKQWSSSNAVQIFVSDGTNTGYWTYFDNPTDGYTGGWHCMVQDSTATFTSTSGTAPTMTAITKVGVRISMTSAPKNVANTFFDIIRFGSGITITGGTAGDMLDLDDIESVSENTTNAYGVIQKRSGVFYISGEITFGSSSAAVYFNDSSQILVWEDKPVQTDLYHVNFVTTADYHCEVTFGAVTGGDRVTSGGCVFKGETSSNEFRFMIEDNDVDLVGFYGCAFIYQGQMNVGNSTTELTGTDVEITGCDFVQCGSIYTNFSSNYSYFDQNTISDPTDQAGVIAKKWPSYYLEKNTFLDCDLASAGRAISFIGGNTYKLQMASFSGNTKDIYFATTNSSNVHLLDSESAQMGYDTGIISTMWTELSYDVKVVNVSKNPINQARVWVRDNQDEIQVNELTATDGWIDSQILVSYKNYYNGVLPSVITYTPFTIRVRKYDYIPYEILKVMEYDPVIDNYVISDDTIATTAEGTVSGWSSDFDIDESVTFNDIIQVLSSHTLKECYEYCRYYTALSANIDLPDPIASVDGLTFITDYDFEIATGVTVTATNQRLVTNAYTLNGTAIFTGVITDLATSQVPIIVTTMISGSTLYLYNGGDLLIQLSVSTEETYYLTKTYDTPYILDVRVRKGSASPFYKTWETTQSVGDVVTTIPVTQELDE